MIIVLDTNALHGDVYAEGQDATTLFEACATGVLEHVEIWTPRGVVEEMVRQFPARIQRMRVVLGAIDHDLFGFGLQRPTVPSADAASVENYRKRLEARLAGPGRKIADHPPDIGRAIEWAAQHRHPVSAKEPPRPPKNEPDLRQFERPKPTPITGVVDGAIWLTAMHAVSLGESVALVTSNTKDFADRTNKVRLHPVLRQDLEEAGLNPDNVELHASIAAFNRVYVAPHAEATAAAQAFLDHGETLEIVKNEIADAAEWFPYELDARWDLRTPIDDSTLAVFEPEALHLVRADPAGDGFYMRIEARGLAHFDVGIHKGDADNALDEDFSIYDWDFNESMVAGTITLPAQLIVDARVSTSGAAEREVDGRMLLVSIEDVQPSVPPAEGA